MLKSLSTIDTLFLWTLSTMISKSKDDGDSWGTLYGRPMEGLVFAMIGMKKLQDIFR